MACKSSSNKISNKWKGLSTLLLYSFKEYTDINKTLIEKINQFSHDINGNKQALYDALDEWLSQIKECCKALGSKIDETIISFSNIPCICPPTTQTTTEEQTQTTTEIPVTPTTTGEPQPSDCNQPTIVDERGPIYGYSYMKYLGTDTGLVTFTYNTFDIPDRFVIEWGDIIIDTGYHGKAVFQAKLNTAVAAYGDTAGAINTSQTGTETFIKDTAEEWAIVKVYAPLKNTRFEFTLSCPQPYETTTTTTNNCFNWILTDIANDGRNTTFDILYCDDTSGIITLINGGTTMVCAVDVITFNESRGTAVRTEQNCPFTTTTTPEPATTTSTTPEPTTTTTEFPCDLVLEVLDPIPVTTTSTTPEPENTTTTTCYNLVEYPCGMYNIYNYTDEYRDIQTRNCYTEIWFTGISIGPNSVYNLTECKEVRTTDCELVFELVEVCTTTTTMEPCSLPNNYDVETELYGTIVRQGYPNEDFTPTLDQACQALWEFNNPDVRNQYIMAAYPHAISKRHAYNDYWRIGDLVFDGDTVGINCDWIPTGFYIVFVPGRGSYGEVIYIVDGEITEYPICTTTTTPCPCDDSELIVTANETYNALSNTYGTYCTESGKRYNCQIFDLGAAAYIKRVGILGGKPVGSPNITMRALILDTHLWGGRGGICGDVPACPSVTPDAFPFNVLAWSTNSITFTEDNPVDPHWYYFCFDNYYYNPADHTNGDYPAGSPPAVAFVFTVNGVDGNTASNYVQFCMDGNTYADGHYAYKINDLFSCAWGMPLVDYDLSCRICYELAPVTTTTTPLPESPLVYPLGEELSPSGSTDACDDANFPYTYDRGSGQDIFSPEMIGYLFSPSITWDNVEYIKVIAINRDAGITLKYNGVTVAPNLILYPSTHDFWQYHLTATRDSFACDSLRETWTIQVKLYGYQISEEVDIWVDFSLTGCDACSTTTTTPEPPLELKFTFTAGNAPADMIANFTFNAPYVYADLVQTDDGDSIILTGAINKIRWINVDYFVNLLEIEGLINCSELEYLYCSGCTGLTSLPTLPDSLTRLWCFYCTGLTSLPTLPDSLDDLSCSNCTGLSNLPSLPTTLRTLSCDNITGLSTIPTLPSTLQLLSCSGCSGLTSLPTLPDSLTRLWCGFISGLTSLPTLPDILEELNCISTGLTSLPTLPDSLTRLWCGFISGLTSLPTLPDSLIDLRCLWCNLTSGEMDSIAIELDTAGLSGGKYFWNPQENSQEPNQSSVAYLSLISKSWTFTV